MREYLSALHDNQKIRFLAIGAWNTLIGYLVFCAVQLAIEKQTSVLVTLIVSYAIALPHSFITQRFLVFRSKNPWRLEFRKFVVANSTIFVANLLLLPIAVSATHLDSKILQAVFLLVSTIVTYIAHKNFTFSR